jgi:transposase
MGSHVVIIAFTVLLPSCPRCSMPSSHDDNAKKRALARHGVLHPHPHLVTDPLFGDGGFFDPLDLLQVKYEMLRHVAIDGLGVGRAAEAAGLSRPSFYSARLAFDEGGLAGLLPARKGPRRAHKLTDEVLDLVEELLREDADLDLATLAAALQQRLGLTVHPRSIDRALHRRRDKKGGL